MSVSDWKKMRRKQQELVLGVWEKMLETMKFRAAKTSDFGTSLDGLYEPKHTPFDVALAALKELSGEPMYHNPCPGCVFLGSHKCASPDVLDLKDVSDEEYVEQKEKVWYDLYYCNQGYGVEKPRLTARWGSAPKDSDSIPGASLLDPESTVGEDRAWMSADPDNCRHPALVIAYGEAVKRGLFD